MKHIYSNVHIGNDQFWSQLKLKTQFFGQKITFVLLIFFFSVNSFQAYAQTCTITSNDQNTGSGELIQPNFTWKLGNSFTACQTGILNKVKALVLENTASGDDFSNITLEIYEGNGVGGTKLATITGNDLHNATTFTDYSEIDVTSLNIPVTSGSQYTFWFPSLVKIYGRTVSMYSGGTYWVDDGGIVEITDRDLYFEIEIGAASATSPTVTTQAVTSVAVTTATGNGNVTATGGANVTERGIYYSTNDGFADGAGTKVSTTGDWSATGAFTQAITGLSAGTTYFVKAFAKNSAGTAYGSQVSFTTLGPPTITSFTPLSEEVGETVTITGTNFNTTPANNVVYFGATKATVSASTAGSLTVTVPTGATYAPITVLNTGTSLAAYSQANFNPIFTPSTGHIVAADLASRVNFPTGETPRLAGIGDIDGDGKPDVVTTSYSPREVSVLLNTGSSGTPNFATKVDFSVGGTPMIVSLGDIDGDGKLDLVIGNGSGASVLRNTSTVGSVSFATKVDLTTGSYPISVAIGDLDGDGKPDLAVENYSSNTVSVFRNIGSSGSISFATKVDFATGTRPTDVSIGDLDGDGKLDMVVSNWSSNTVSVFRNTSTSGSINSSSFAAKVDFATATNPRYISIGDLDGDAKLDLTVVNQGSDNISILHNTATSGTINSSSFATKVDYTAGSDPHSAPIGDINGDGKPDLAIGNHGSDNISILRNTSTSGAISFAAKVDIASGDRPYSVSIGDVDGDGKPDLVAANYGDDDISVLLNTPASAPTVTTQAVSDITTITATGNGNVTATGGVNITERGIYYSTSDGFADGAGTKVSTTGDWSTAGAFTQAITGLSSGTTYYVKAYAKNSVGTGYGSQVSFTTPWQPLDNNALEFDGIDDHVEVTTTLSPSFTQGTISFWIKPKATPSNHARVFSDYWNDDEIYLQNGTGKVATYQMINGGDLMSSNPLPNNTWTHVAITMNTTSSQLYINGVLDDESGSSETEISSDYEIGGYSTNYPDSPEVINGYLDEFRIWSVVRTEKEIREYMCRALTGNEDNLIAYYNFDHSSGTVLQDFSGNGNDGILTNMDDADWVDSEAFTTWLGGTSNDWTTASNWTDGVPTSTDNVGVYKWSGNSEATISGTPTVNNMVISSSASPRLGSNITVNGNLILEKNLGLNGKTVTLGSGGTLIEDAGVFSGTSGLITTTRSLSNISSENVAGIGAVITNTSDLGSTTISRGHNTGITSLKRYYQISPTNNPSNATLVFNYHETELNSLSEGGLKLFKSADGNTWSKQTSSVVNTSENTISLTGINSFSYWTGAEEIPTYYMAKSAGNWSITSIWYTNSTGGTDPSTYTTVATTSPTALNSDGIIVNADVAVDTDVSIDQTTVNSGASLGVNNGTTLTIANGTGNDLTITGAITNNGTIAPAASTTIVYDGADQTILPLNYSELSFNGSASGSTKTFADGTTLVAQEITIAEAMTLTGSAADAVTVQVITPGEGGTTSRVFNINASGETISISNMTIKGGDISGNGDITAGYGGGVYIAAGIVNFDGTEISGSKAYKGGGIYGTDCTVSLSNSLLTNNSASYQAGGLFAILSDASLTECTVSNNTTVHSASGVFANNSNLEVTKCTFNNNSGSTSGNAIYSFVNSGLSGTSVNLTVTESTIAYNTGGASGGGGIAAYGQSSKAIYTVIKNSTISGNSATSSGYGVYFYQNIGTPRSTMEISNSIIVNNSGTDYNYIGYGTLTDGGYNVVENANVAANATGGFNNSTSILYNTMNGDATITNSSWTQGGSDLTNQNLNLASILADNGGPTQTLALEEGSFAAASATTGIPPASNWNSSPEIDGAYTDQRGVTRTAGQNTSIGAYSANYDPCTNPTSGGSIGTAQTICYQATPNALTSVSVPTGQTGDLEFKWQSSTTSSSTGFSDIESSNTTGYSPGSLSDTTWFKRLARVDCETDWSGAVESNVVEVAVYDLPVANCQDIIVYLDSAGSVSIDSSDINNGSTYGCGLMSMTVDNSEFICSDIGGNTVTLTVTDLSDNTDFCESTVTVSDTIPPTANCQNITVYLDGSGNATIDSLAIDNNSSGNCSLASHVLDISSFDCSNVGANTVVMTVTDVNSNTSACSATVTVSDTIPPTANCQNITVYLDGSGIATIDSLAIDNNSSGNCSLASHVLDISSFDCSNVGANTVVMTVTDVNSNTSACSATVTVSDTIPPIANCQNITVYLDGTGNATIDSLAIDNNSSGNCSLASHVLDISSFDCSNVGANTVVMTVTDVNSNTSACSATVTVSDTIPPTANCQNITVYLDGTGNATIDSLAIDNNSSGNCSLASHVLDISSFDCSNVGVNTVVMTVTDVNSNTSACSATVTVSDTIPPTANCQNITVYLDGTGNAIIDSLAIDNNSSGNCSLASHVLDISSFDCSNVGANTVVMSVTDANSNTSTCSATVTVYHAITPTANCQNITVYLDETGNATIDSLAIDNSSSDNCSLASHALDISSFDCSDVGANTVVMTVTDVNSNTSTCSATVVVVDNVDPFIRCNNYQVNLYEDGSNVITWQMVIDSVWDNCDSELLSYHLTQDTFTCSDAGMNISINVTATNTNGDFVTCEASVTVLDMMDPKIVCTEGVEVDLWGNGEYVMDATSLAALTSGSWDNCTDITDSLKYSLGTYSFDCSNIETLQALVEVTATDENGNSSTAYCPVTVYDVTDPVASCVDTFEIILDDNGNGIIFPGDINEAGASYDVCGIATMELSQTTVGCSDLGFVPVTLSVYDPSGNSDECTFIVEVIDDIAPKLTPVSDIVLTVVPPACDANLEVFLPMLVATDPCLDSIWITNGVDLNGAFPLGATEVIWAAADLAGNTNQDTFTIKVGAYNAAPTIDAINDQFVEEDSGLLVVPISGISTGNDCPAVEQSIVSVEALSNNTALITDITVEHTLGAGRIELTLVPDMSGTATIAVTVIDDGGTTNGWINTTIETFEVTVAPVNDAPILVDSIADQEINADKVLKLPISPALGEVFDDEDDPVLTISVTMEDGSTLPDFAEYINDTLTVTPFRENMGCYEIMVTATDSSGATATDQFQLCVLDWITGTDEFVNLAKAQLYPNPTEGMVTLEISGNHSSEVEVVVMNILGKEVLKKDFHTKELLQIDMSEHVSGMYIVKLIVDGNEIVKKLILDPK